MKILTLTGTRPELIRLSLIIKKLDKIVNHILVYTNQNYDPNLSTIFFEQLNIRKPDYYFGQPQKQENKFLESSLENIERAIKGDPSRDYPLHSDPSFEKTKGTFGKFFSESIIKFEEIILKEKPDKILVLGDTNSGLLSIVAEKHNIPIYHMEAGNRCYDNRLPEETNRRIIDAVSTYNLPYTEDSKQILLNEGFHRNNIFKTGNPIYEVLNHYKNNMLFSDVLVKLGLQNSDYSAKDYVLVTAHRTENVDDFKTLRSIVVALNEISQTHKVVFSVHPRTMNKIENFKLDLGENIIVSEPFGFFDFVRLEQKAKCIITDSGTVQEEGCIFGVPTITIRESTERRETIECGSNVLSGTQTKDILDSFNMIMGRKFKWVAPSDYLVGNVSDTVVNILIGKR